jgi:hypothetical protein
MDQQTISSNTEEILKKKIKTFKSKESLAFQKEASSSSLAEKTKQNNSDSELESNLCRTIKDDFDKKSFCFQETQLKTLEDNNKEEYFLLINEINRNAEQKDFFFDFSFDCMKNFKYYFKHNNPDILINTKLNKILRRKKSMRSLLGKMGKAARSTLLIRKLNGTRNSSNKSRINI